jgi:alkylresorcinol/alkylpyrone synthase
VLKILPRAERRQLPGRDAALNAARLVRSEQDQRLDPRFDGRNRARNLPGLKMFLLGVSTAVPPRTFTQAECLEALHRANPPQVSARARALLEGILGHDHGIERRALALESLDESFDLDPDTLHRRFARHAPQLASDAAHKALSEAGIGAPEVDAVIVSTCTGYLCPGLTSYVGERLALRPDAFHLDLVGQGCAAALPNLQAADALIASGRASNVLCICVEVCSAAFYLDNDMGVLVSACIFGDGAAAAVVSSEPPADRRRVEWRAFASRHEPAQRDALRFEQRDGMLRNILTLGVPKLAARHAGALLEDTLAEHDVPRDAIRAWILHAGGRKVLEELRGGLGLAPQDLRWSSAMLREYGNLSSPFVLFVLRAALDGKAPGGTWWMSSFGAGFSCHGALLEVA